MSWYRAFEIPKAGTPLEGLDLRKTFSLSRSTGEIEQVGEVEEWKRMPQRQRIRKGILHASRSLFLEHVKT